MTAMKTAVWWIRNDMRLLDNKVLCEAAKSAGNRVLAVYVFDEKAFTAKLPHIHESKFSSRRIRFLVESVADLSSNLQARGVSLIVKYGDPQRELASVCSSFQASEIFACKELCKEEVDQEKSVASINGVNLNLVWDSTLVRLEDLPYKHAEFPLVYTEFRKKVEANLRVEAIFQIPKLIPVDGHERYPSDDLESIQKKLMALSGDAAGEVKDDPRAVLNFKGGATAGSQRVEYYIENHLSTYKQTRNGMIGANYSSKFSPWLANGCISPRTVYHRVRQYEKERVANDSTYWLLFELLWRDYFKFLPLRVGDSIFFLKGPLHKTKPWKVDIALFHKWCNGTTGYALIDASMKELALSGYMSNRARQIVASFLTKDMGIDWRLGAEWFEKQLLDHSPELNYGNWTYSAGVGTDPRADRYFSIPKQTKNFDPQLEFCDLWLDGAARQVQQSAPKFPATLGQFAPPLRSKRGKQQYKRPRGQKTINDFYKKRPQLDH